MSEISVKNSSYSDDNDKNSLNFQLVHYLSFLIKKTNNMKNLVLRNNTPVKSIFDIFNDDFFNDDFFKREIIPSVNIKENTNEFLVEVAAPGYKKDSFNIEVQKNYLKIYSKNELDEEDKNDKYHRKEFSYSSFERSFYLPDNIDTENIKASYNDGILNVSIPKIQKRETISKLIEIQ